MQLATNFNPRVLLNINEFLRNEYTGVYLDFIIMVHIIEAFHLKK